MEELMTTLQNASFVGVEAWRIVAFFGAILVIWILGKLGGVMLTHAGTRLESQRRPIAATGLKQLGRGIGVLSGAIGLRIGFIMLNLEGPGAIIGDTATRILVTLSIGWLAYLLMEVPHQVFVQWSKKQQSRLTDMLAPMLRASLRAAVVVLTLVEIAQTLSDKPVSSIIAGLGVGGLAVALAAQDSLKHFFGSVVILADRPFEVGDRLIVDGVDGPVEEVGFRSTRIRTLDGHLVTIPNGELVNKSIRNVGKRPHIRRLMNVTITYDTPPAKVQEAVDILKDILANHEGMQEDFPPRVFFSDFNSESLNILVLYWYHPADYWAYMAFSEKVNQQILERFNAAGIDFAFPTRTLHLAGDPKRPLEIGLRGGGARRANHNGN